MTMRNARIISIVVGVLILAGAAAADWDPGDGHKMHYPQMPDPNGWDVAMNWSYSPADDWLCTESGPVSDIHMWYSWQDDAEGLFAGVALTIWSDSPDPDGPGPLFSHPDEVLWGDAFFVASGDVTTRLYGIGDQGWYDPATGSSYRPDHSEYHQLNVDDIQDPFIQEAGTVYWLQVDIIWYLGGFAGWKTSLDHFNDNAVWYDTNTDEWRELIDPITYEPLDLAFVITPEPGTMSLFALGALGLLRRRRRS